MIDPVANGVGEIDLQSRRGRDGLPGRAPGGAGVVQRSLTRLPKPYVRVRHGTYFVADCATGGEVARLVDLATLVPEQRP